jgi:predicted lipase
MTTTELIGRRELAHRTNDGIDVTLFWSKASNRVTISVLHTRSATALEFDVDGADALDAFNHPYAYAATSGARHIATPHRVMNP